MQNFELGRHVAFSDAAYLMILFIEFAKFIRLNHDNANPHKEMSANQGQRGYSRIIAVEVPQQLLTVVMLIYQYLNHLMYIPGLCATVLLGTLSQRMGYCSWGHLFTRGTLLLQAPSHLKNTPLLGISFCADTVLPGAPSRFKLPLGSLYACWFVNSDLRQPGIVSPQS